MGTPLKSENETGGGVQVGVQDSPQPQTTPPPNTSPIRDTTPTIFQGEHQQRNEAIATGTNLTPEERAKRKARLATILDRGVVQDRLNVNLPPHMYGEWVRDDPLEINRLRTMGFEVDREFAPNQSLHNDGTGAARVADVIFMTTSRENKEIIDEIRNEAMIKSHAPKPKGKAQKEEAEFVESVESGTGGIVPTFIESNSRVAKRDDIAAAMREADSQIVPINQG